MALISANGISAWVQRGKQIALSAVDRKCLRRGRYCQTQLVIVSPSPHHDHSVHEPLTGAAPPGG